MLKVERSAWGYWKVINREVLKSDGKALTIDEEALKGNEEALKGNVKTLKGNEETGMGDNRRYRATMGL